MNSVLTDKRNHGYILNIVLVFLLILSFISVHSLIYSIDIVKITQEQIRAEHYKHLAKQLLTQIESELIDLPLTCRIDLTPAFMYKRKPLRWWQQNGCYGRFDAIEYYYVIEFLQTDSCSIIKEKPYNDDNLIAAYQRITVCLIRSSTSLNNIIMQSTIIIPHQPNNIPCKGWLHKVNLGRQMLREL